MPTNDFVPFCPTDTGTNLLEQAAYLADPQLAIGNQPGVARLQLVNKALRQATYIASCFAQYMVNKTGSNAFDDATPSEILTLIAAAFNNPPTIQKFLTGSGTYTTPAGVTYIRVKIVGGGGGGGAAGNAPGSGGTSGGQSSFGGTLLVCPGGASADTAEGGGLGGVPSFTAGPLIISAQTGNPGQTIYSSHASGAVVFGGGGNGGASPFGGAGLGGNDTGTGGAATINSGSGGGGGGVSSASPANFAGPGGGSGAFIEAIIAAPSATYAYVIGVAGTGETSVNAQPNGGNGGNGYLVIEEHYGA